MDHRPAAIIYDCEFLVSDGAPQRFWCGPHDPDPVIAQIGAVKLALDGPYEILEKSRLFVRARDRKGTVCKLDPLFTRLTGITDEIIESEGLELSDALSALQDFATGNVMWSWGKDEFNMLAISCYVAGIQPPIPVTQFGNACHLLLEAGMPYEDLKVTRSNGLVGYFELDHPPLRGHDALDDALSVTYVLQHLLELDKLTQADFDPAVYSV